MLLIDMSSFFFLVTLLLLPTKVVVFACAVSALVAILTISLPISEHGTYTIKSRPRSAACPKYSYLVLVAMMITVVIAAIAEAAQLLCTYDYMLVSSPQSAQELHALLPLLT